MGIGKFWYFMEMSKELNLEGNSGKSQEELQQYIKTFEDGIKDLKNSVKVFEDFEAKFKPGLEKGELSVVQMKQKLFVDEFFDTSIKETLIQDYKNYDLKDNAINEKMIGEIFEKGESALPISNLAEISVLFNKLKEALALFDVSLKIVSNKEPDNLLRFKLVSYLAAIVNYMGHKDQFIKMNASLLKGLEGIDDFCKVFILRNYGHILTQHKEHKEEGEDYMNQANELAKNYPYWAERKMALFTPVLPDEHIETPL
jgi:tetratricopeptide (TPR) repeat protein